jgi:hypothetical protein
MLAAAPSVPPATLDPVVADLNAKLEDLSTVLAAQPTDIAEVLDIKNQADLLYSYLVTIHASRDLQVEAAELRLRAERAAGTLLLAEVTLGDGKTAQWRHARSGAGRYRLPEGVLEQVKLTAKQSSNFQALARIPEATFEQELQRRRQKNVPASRQAILKLVAGIMRPRGPGGSKTSDTARLLRHALDRLRRVSTLHTGEELRLARDVARIGSTWSRLVFRPKADFFAQAPDGNPTHLTCSLCARSVLTRHCGVCAGFLMELPAESDDDRHARWGAPHRRAHV